MSRNVAKPLGNENPSEEAVKVLLKIMAEQDAKLSSSVAALDVQQNKVPEFLKPLYRSCDRQETEEAVKDLLKVMSEECAAKRWEQDGFITGTIWKPIPKTGEYRL